MAGPDGRKITFFLFFCLFGSAKESDLCCFAGSVWDFRGFVLFVFLGFVAFFRVFVGLLLGFSRLAVWL